MASNPILDILRIKDLRDRILFTLGVLIVFRLGAILPIPGINVNALKLYFMSQQGSGGAGIGIVEYINFFSGGAFLHFSVFMLGIMPYITTSIIMQLLVVVFPRLKKIQEEEGGKKKIHRYTRIGTIFVCLVQSYAVTIYANQIPDAITMARLPYTLLAMLTVTAGTMFLMWMGEQITQRGVGQGPCHVRRIGVLGDVDGKAGRPEGDRRPQRRHHREAVGPEEAQLCGVGLRPVAHDGDGVEPGDGTGLKGSGRAPGGDGSHHRCPDEEHHPPASDAHRRDEQGNDQDPHDQGLDLPGEGPAEHGDEPGRERPPGRAPNQPDRRRQERENRAGQPCNSSSFHCRASLFTVRLAT